MGALGRTLAHSRRGGSVSGAQAFHCGRIARALTRRPSRSPAERKAGAGRQKGQQHQLDSLLWATQRPELWAGQNTTSQTAGLLRGWLCQGRNSSTMVLIVGGQQQPGKDAGEAGCSQAVSPHATCEARRPMRRFPLLPLESTSTGDFGSADERTCEALVTLELWLASTSRCWEAVAAGGRGSLF